ncbi:hypothetical protein JHD48_05780 [Sulfurimonas sp. SAG-AH-194-I05]|nr:hypothetical protein [Sulfurimonas sp. SAG-AH-194-I05]MDF1875235.1 hypothetical protein [Sulfurimonas sp. SAG-AH-194-I05]
MKNIVLFIWLFSYFAHAEVFMQEATYIMGDDDSKMTAKRKAILIAKRDSIEKAGVYMSSYSKSINGILMDDVIENFSASVLKTTVLEEVFHYPKYWVKIKAEIDIDLLNKKIQQFVSSAVHVDTQIKSAQNEIEQYNEKLEKLLDTRNKKKFLKEIQEKKRLLINKVKELSNAKNITFDTVSDTNYAYITITSPIEFTEVYRDEKYIGMAPIHMYKVPANKIIHLKGVNDKRYYPEDIVLSQSYKKLSSQIIHLEFKKADTELFLIGKENAKLYINNVITRTIFDDTRVIKIPAGKNIRISIVHQDGCFSVRKDLWANKTYEMNYRLNKKICSSLENTIEHNGLAYKTVLSPFTGKVWLDRNLGAKRVCTAVDDSSCYGDYYQWGRDADGHEKKRSKGFIKGKKQNRYDWNESQDDTLWKGRNAKNNPCPKSFRIPSIDELYAETIQKGIRNKGDAFMSFLKLPASGFKSKENGYLENRGRYTQLWSSNVEDIYAKYIYFDTKHFGVDSSSRANGNGVRCIKNSRP